LPASKGYSHPLIIMDRTYRWLEVIPIAGTSTVDCGNALFQEWVSRFGVPAVITSDHGTQFTSSLRAALCSLLNIQHSQTTAYHLQSNSMVEHFHCRLRMHSAPAALQRTRWTTSPGSSWASVQQPEKMTAPPRSGSVWLTTHFT
jgi:transposase InsO family protein